MDTYNRLISVCNAVFDGEIDLNGVTPESDLKNDIGINSIGLLYMALALEEEFKIKFTNDDFIHIQTVKDVVDIIEKKVG